MGWFSSDEKKAPKKNVEIISGNNIQLEEKIEKRIEEGRIIKDIKLAGEGVGIAMVLIIYDSWAEKARDEKERAEKEKEGLGR